MAERDWTTIQKERDSILEITTKKVYFFDINKQGLKTSYKNNDIALLQNEIAVMESVSNILLTQPGERVMDPLFGCELEQFLFAPIVTWTAQRIVETISAAILKYEPRVIDHDIIVTPVPDDNTFEIEIELILNTSRDVVVFQTTLEKVR